jgi:hypothetical protein
MTFHEYRTLWEEMRGRLPRQATEEQLYAAAMAGGIRTGNGLILAEGSGDASANRVRPGGCGRTE